MRLKRQELLTAAKAPRVWSVMDEAALRRPVGGVTVMRAQLRWLAEVAQLPNVTLQVVPFEAGGHDAAGGSFTILRFSEHDVPDVVYIEQLTGAIYLEKPAATDHYLDIMNRLSATSLDPGSDHTFPRPRPPRAAGVAAGRYPGHTTRPAAAGHLPGRAQPMSRQDVSADRQGSDTAAAEPASFDITRAHPARVYDYWLGGKDNYEADREAAQQVIEAIPNILAGVRANRAFLRRAVQYLAGEAGIRQFLDIGTGLPTAENTHEVAQAIAPESRIVYVDNDPIVLAHARALLTSTPEGATAYVDADARDTATILAAAAGVLDFSQPIAVMSLLVLQYVPDEDRPHEIVSRLMDAVPSGSYLTISDTTTDIDTERATDATARLNARLGPAHSTLRTREQIERYFDGLELVEPGIVPMPQWRTLPNPLVIPVLRAWAASPDAAPRPGQATAPAPGAGPAGQVPARGHRAGRRCGAG